MDCPRCRKVELASKDYKGIEVDSCPQCKGLWLDQGELDQLEDTVLNEDHLKGTMLFAQRESDILCPKCQGPMTTFNYRAYNLPLDFCNGGHGFWLDRGEEERVLDLMEKRIRDLKRSSTAEAEWTAFLKGVRSKSFLGRIKNRFLR